MYDYCVIGAGPAGILTILTLYETMREHDKKILWIDPKFKVGRLGQCYNHVESNNYISDWVSVLQKYSTFTDCISDQDCCIDCHCFISDLVKDSDKRKDMIEQKKDLHNSAFQQMEANKINSLDEPTGGPIGQLIEMSKTHPKTVCKLEFLNRVLMCLTKKMQTKSNIYSKVDYVTKIKQNLDNWKISTRDFSSFNAKYVFLTIGSHPISPPLEKFKYTISLDVALDPKRLQYLVSQDHTIGVVGSGSSAYLVIRHLINCQPKPKMIYNFYRGSKEDNAEQLDAHTKTWYQDQLRLTDQSNFIMVHDTDPNRDYYYQKCTKIINAIGFEINKLPTIKLLDNSSKISILSTEKTHCGLLAPRLFGLGIAFPNTTIVNGKKIKMIGIGSFQKVLETELSNWLQNE